MRRNGWGNKQGGNQNLMVGSIDFRARNLCNWSEK